MADWAILGGIGKGVTEGLDDKRKMDEAAQQKKLRQLQIDTAQDEQDFRKSVKGIRKVGSPTYDSSYQSQGAGPAQAKALDAQTADFGPEGAQATANALAGAKGLQSAPPVKSIPYAASDQASDIADLAVKAGRPEVAAQFQDRAFTLGQREVQERTNQYIRAMQSPDVTLQAAVKAFSDLHTADKTPYASFLRPQEATPDNPNAYPMVTMFDAKTGQSVTHVVQSKAELAQLAQSLVDHNTRHAIMQEQMQQAELGLKARAADAADKQAGAAEKNANTMFEKFNAEKSAGLFEAQVEEMRAKAKMYPAQAGYYEAHADQARAIAKEMKSKANSWEGKLGDAEKFFLNTLQKNALETQKEAAADPNPANQLRAKAAMFQLTSQMAQFGAKNFDPYALSGVPRPEVAVQTMLAGSKDPTPKEIEMAKQSVQPFGQDYAKAVSDGLDAALAKRAADKAKVATSNSIGDAPRGPFGLITGSPHPDSVAAKIYKAAEAAKASAKPGEVPGLVDIYKQYR